MLVQEGCDATSSSNPPPSTGPEQFTAPDSALTSQNNGDVSHSNSPKHSEKGYVSPVGEESAHDSKTPDLTPGAISDTSKSNPPVDQTDTPRESSLSTLATEAPEEEGKNTISADVPPDEIPSRQIPLRPLLAIAAKNAGPLNGCTTSSVPKVVDQDSNGSNQPTLCSHGESVENGGIQSVAAESVQSNGCKDEHFGSTSKIDEKTSRLESESPDEAESEDLKCQASTSSSLSNGDVNVDFTDPNATVSATKTTTLSADGG